MKIKIRPFIASLWVLILVPTMVVAYYKDKETSNENTFTASTLDTEINPHSSETIELLRNNSVTFTTTITNIGQLTTSNNQILLNSDNSQLANTIEMTVTAGSTTVYTGNISGFTISNYLTQTNGQSTTLKYTFFISSEDYDSNPSSTLNLTIRNTAWHQGVTPGIGFSDSEDIQIELENSTPFLTPTLLLSPVTAFETPAENLIDLNGSTL